MHLENIQDLIGRRYARAHGATPATDYPHYCMIAAGREEAPSAVLGFRSAGQGRLFLEDYLDVPIEAAVSRAFARSIDRSRIVEIGAHASDRSRATVALWARAVRHLDQIADVAVAVLTAPLRGMFARLGITVIEICDADPARLGDAGAGWGRYYDLDPKVCAGLIAPAKPRLAHFDDGLSGVCA